MFTGRKDFPVRVSDILHIYDNEIGSPYISSMYSKIVFVTIDLFFPALKCEDKNAEYRSSGSGCPATCLDPHSEDTCTLDPTEGCFCKAGFVLSDGACVPQGQCGCKNDKGDYYPVTTSPS